MIIERLDLMAFGRFTDVSLDLSAGPRRFHVIYGPNESGKSTSLRAITSLFYGIATQSTDNYLHPYPDLRIGARLVGDNGEVMECVRRKGTRNTLKNADQSQTIEEATLRRMLGGVDQATFLNRFGLSHQELLAGGRQILSGDGELGEILFSAGAGVSELRDLLDQLELEAGTQFKPRGKGSINLALKDLDGHRKELREVQVAPAEFAQVNQRLEERLVETDAIAKELRAANAQRIRLRAMLEALPLLPKLENDTQHLSSVVNAPFLAEGFSDRRREAENQIRMTEERSQELGRQIQRIEDEIAGLVDDPEVRLQEEDIDSLYRDIATRQTAEHDRGELIRLTGNVERKIIALLQELDAGPSIETSNEEQDPFEEGINQLRLSQTAWARIDRMAKEHAKLVQKQMDASQRVETIQSQLETLAENQSDDEELMDPTALGGLLEEIGSPKSMAAAHDDQVTKLKRSQSKVDQAARRLGLINRDKYSTFDRSSVPTDKLSKLAEGIRKQTAASQELQLRKEGLQTEHHSVQNKLDSLGDQQTLPTLEDLKDIRRQRDEVLDVLETGDLDKKSGRTRLARLRQLVRQEDQWVDDTCRFQDQIQQRAQWEQERQRLDRLTEEVSAEMERSKRDLDESTQKWNQIWQEMDVDVVPAERLESWLSALDQWAVLVEQSNEDSIRLSRLKSDVHQAAMRLHTALKRVTSRPLVMSVAGESEGNDLPLFDAMNTEELFGIEDLVNMHDEAIAVRAKLTEAYQKNAERKLRIETLSREFPDAKQNRKQTEEALTHWQTDWNDATKAIAKDGLSPDDVTIIVRLIDELLERQREREILLKRQNSIRRDHDVFVQAVLRLVGERSGEESQPSEVTLQDAIDSLEQLHRRLQLERTSRKGRDQLQRQLQASREELDQIHQRRAGAQAMLVMLCEESGCDRPDQLAAIEQHARRKQEIQRDIQETESRLKFLAGAQPWDEFMQVLKAADVETLSDQVAACEKSIERLEDQFAEANKEIGSLQLERKRMDGSERASALNQDIQVTVGRVHREAEQWAQKKLASVLLGFAMDRYRQENQDPVLRHAEHYFQTLTCQEYSGLKADFDDKGKPALFGLRGGKEVPAVSMSTGTADALYLALRLASLQHQLEHSVALPLIVDDCLIQLDDRRCLAALQAFSELSETTQVILLTHHSHLLDLAKQGLSADQYHVHELPAA